MIRWQDTLSQNGMPWEAGGFGLADGYGMESLEDLKAFLDAVHIRMCLVRPYQNLANYPLVEPRELLPSFDNAMFEYKELPGFSMLAIDRKLSFFRERFQYDILHSTAVSPNACLLEKQVLARNMQTFLSRLPRVHQDVFRQQFAKKDLTDIRNYPALMPYLLNMDRAHVLSRDPADNFVLAGIFASFPSDIDSELKRFGLSIGKFTRNDDERYARNRQFVYQFLMELYGFPIVSERRTSAAMFARKLTLTNERFMLRVLGQTDRTITTYTSQEGSHHFPKVEKIALIAVDADQEDAIQAIASKGFFLDQENRVIILRVTYRQHRYDQANIRQDRALSVASQEIIHPLTGQVLKGLNIIRDATNMYLRLNDIVHGEYTGHVVYKRTEIIESTESDEKRLKVLYYWLTKNQRRMIDYSEEFFAKINRVLTGYLFSPEKDEEFGNLRELHIEVCSRLGYIQQARRVRLLEELRTRTFHGDRITYRQMIQLALEAVTNLKFELVHFFPDIVENVIACLERITSDRYIIRRYIQHQDGRTPSKNALEIRKGYGALVSATDDLKKMLRNRKNWQPPKATPSPRQVKERPQEAPLSSSATDTVVNPLLWDNLGQPVVQSLPAGTQAIPPKAQAGQSTT